MTTSSIDWCEDNFVYSDLIAEFHNTISSFSMIIAGSYLLVHYKFYLIYSLMILVGIGSVLFHAMLTKYTQALDEVPMIWLALSLIYYSLKQLNYINSFVNKLLIFYGVISSFSIVIPNGTTQFQTFHALNTFITVAIVILFYILATKKNLINRYISGFIFFFTGIICWLLDLWFCEYFKHLNLHAFWHIFSSIGTYKIICILN